MTRETFAVWLCFTSVTGLAIVGGFEMLRLWWAGHLPPLFDVMVAFFLAAVLATLYLLPSEEP